MDVLCLRRIAILVVCAICLLDRADADEFPYAAFVATEDARALSGPGEDFYATRELAWGSRVEVYRHDNEFAAIRPTPNAFSLVPADRVEISADRMSAEVTQPGVTTRIGSTLGPSRDVEYITLEVGETLSVLGFETTGEADARQEWVRVAPPAGEFRWVALAHLQTSPPVRQESTEPTLAQDAPTPAPYEPTVASLEDETEGAAEFPEDESPARDDAEWNELEEPIAQEGELEPMPLDPELTGEAEEPAESGVALAQWGYDLSPKQQLPPRSRRRQDELRVARAGRPYAVAARPSRSPLTDPVTPPSSTTPFGFSERGRTQLRETSPAYLTLQLDKLEIAVSHEVCKPTSEWQLGSIQGSCLAVIDAAGDAEVRQRAHALLAKIVQFEDIHRREERLADRPASLAPSDFAELTPRTDAAAANLYDGSGWLMPVLTNRSDVPRYVLTDDQGRVLQFVSPKPGMNLGPYERKRIGIYGQRGYLPSVSQPHLMAERIVSLDKVDAKTGPAGILR
ncbi:MAG: hypothetical protein AAGF97_19265 [Planctomycetota bacterium]